MTRQIASSPTVRRRVLAAELKNLRHSARLTHVDVANRLGWQQGKVSKIESARQGVPVEVVIAFAELCDATPQHRDRLVGLAKAARVRAWWESYGDVLSSEWKTYLGLETDADRIAVFATETIPELLQSDDYTANVLSARSSPEIWAVWERQERTERRIEMLRKRQHIVLEKHKAEIDVILSESTLSRVVGSDRVLSEALLHVANLAERPNVTVRILPFSAGVLPAEGPFIMFGFTEEPHPEVVFVPHRAGAVHVEQEGDVELYHAALRDLGARSLNVEDSSQMLRRAGSAVRDV